MTTGARGGLLHPERPVTPIDEGGIRFIPAHHHPSVLDQHAPSEVLVCDPGRREECALLLPAPRAAVAAEDAGRAVRGVAYRDEIVLDRDGVLKGTTDRGGLPQQLFFAELAGRFAHQDVHDLGAGVIVAYRLGKAPAARGDGARDLPGKGRARQEAGDGDGKGGGGEGEGKAKRAKRSPRAHEELLRTRAELGRGLWG
jgi:hypothetical protein